MPLSNKDSINTSQKLWSSSKNEERLFFIFDFLGDGNEEDEVADDTFNDICCNFLIA